jgi:hypothetical protein
MPDTFYVRTNDKKQYVEAKFLRDINGNPIVSPNQVQSSYNLFDSGHNHIGTNANGYIIVPADFDAKTAIDFGITGRHPHSNRVHPQRSSLSPIV